MTLEHRCKAVSFSAQLSRALELVQEGCVYREEPVSLHVSDWGAVCDSTFSRFLGLSGPVER